jgi:hypothetical protein
MKDPIRGMKDKQNQIHHMKTKIDWKQYEKRVAELENEGLCTSDAQSVADVEFAASPTPSGATPGPWTGKSQIAGIEAARAAIAKAEGRDA